MLAPSIWLGYCWWDVVGLDYAYEGTTLIFCVVLDFGGIVCEGLFFLFFFLLPLSTSQLPSGVTNCKVVGCDNVGLLLAAPSPSFLDKRVGTGLASA